MKQVLFSLLLAASLSQAQEVIVVNQTFTTTQALGGSGQTINTPNSAYVSSPGYTRSQTITTPSGTYQTVPNYSTGGTMAVIQTSRSGRTK